jgi:siroheme decarboxylase
MPELAAPQRNFMLSASQEYLLRGEVDRQIIDNLQGEFPICERPYAEVAGRLGISEDDLLLRLERLLADKVLTRFGPMYQIERMGGAFLLAALAAPEARYEEVTALVNALPQVAHNYRREHTLNMWFVLATETPGGIDEAVMRIERDTGLPVYAFPKEREFFVEMKLETRL